MADGIASKDTTIGPIDVSQLIGRANPDIVGPRATAALGDAFRSGFITADDVLNRVGEKGRAQEKAQIDIANAQSMSAQEQTSPEAQAARAAGLGATTEQAALAKATALRSQVLQQYPAVAYFDKFAPAAGIEAPVTSDGKPDYKEMEKIGSEMAVWQSQKTEAQAKRDNIIAQESNDGSILYARTKQGLQVQPKEVERLERLIARPFQRRSPEAVFSGDAGSISVEPRGIPPAPVIDPAEPAQSTATPGDPMAIMSLGPPKLQLEKPEDAAAAAMKLSAAQAQIPIIEGAKAAVARGGGVGPLEGSLPMQIGNRIGAAIGLSNSTTNFNDQRTLEQAISAKILEGAQVMKGNLSDKDVRFLQATVPKLSDSESVWNTYLNRWEQMNQTNIDILSGKMPRNLSVDRFAPKDWVDPATVQQGPPAPGTPALPAVKTAAEAKALPPTVQFFIGGDGERYKNPNYRQ